MDWVEIDMVGLQTTERILKLLADLITRNVRTLIRRHLSASDHLRRHFRRDEDRSPTASALSQPTTDHFLGAHDLGSIDIRRIKKN